MGKAGLIRIAVILAAVLALEIACRTGAVPPSAVVPPSAMLASVYEILTTGEIAHDLRLTLTAVVIATIIAIVGGFFAGLIIHGLPRLRRTLAPLLAAYYAIPHLAFYPLLIVVFGLGLGPLIVLASLLGIMAMIIATLDGLDHVPRVLLRTAAVLRLNRWSEMMLVRLPAAFPHLLSGIKLAFSYAFIGVVAGEFILSTAGLGHAISFAYDNFQNRRMYGLILIAIGLVTLVNTTLLVGERRLLTRRGMR
ncbi:ABC transporter permease [Bradyrhizobium sp. LHD-71]|uniref:ABC transporter permease n=1 Tax=Bradyrhizobium sp. LHD-71 TaxID=3072141 RepID=UPI00281057E8|nr:ABC transporter permease [Bradyrhizobium sp. LHD-71]MDQ8728484.1 ABC transporter permease [Bradyrhizobium sp. LHD-71]